MSSAASDFRLHDSVVAEGQIRDGQSIRIDADDAGALEDGRPLVFRGIMIALLLEVLAGIGIWQLYQTVL